MESNYPPGVYESMIPGSRPEDVEEEKLWDEFCGLQKKHSSLLDKPQVQELIRYAIRFGIDKGSQKQLQVFAENRYYQDEYMEDKFSSILRMLHWRMGTGLNVLHVADRDRGTEKWEVTATFGLGGSKSRSGGVHPTLIGAVTKLFNWVKELTKGDEELNRKLQKEESRKDWENYHKGVTYEGKAPL